MSNRAPSVTWKEIDLSQVAPATGGTSVLVAGFATKGQDERPLNITGSASWQTIFGRPYTEAEIYFYKACMKVLDQGGSLIAAKIPYTNEAAGVYRAVDYSIKQMKPSGGNGIFAITNQDVVGTSSTVKEYWTTCDLTAYILKPNVANSDGLEAAIYAPSAMASGIKAVEANNAETLQTVLSNIITDTNERLGNNINDYDIKVTKNGANVYRFKPIEAEFSPVSSNVIGVLTNSLSSEFEKNNIDINTGLWNFEPDGKIKTVSDDALGIYRVGLLPEENTENKNLSEEGKPAYFDDMIDGGSIRIVDISHARLQKDNNDSEVLGIFPVILAAGNILGEQGVIDYSKVYSIESTFKTINEKFVKITGIENVSPVVGVVAEDIMQDGNKNFSAKIGPINFETSAALANLTNDNPNVTPVDREDNNNNYDSNLAYQLTSADSSSMTLSKDIMDLFPLVNIGEDGTMERDYLNQLLVAVVVAYADTLAGGKINFKIAETFVGSPWKSAVDKSTGASIYLGDVINGTSNYIEFYSNLENGIKIPDQFDPKTLYFSDIITTKNDKMPTSLEGPNNFTADYAKIAKLTGFTEKETQKNISSAQIIQSLQSIFDKVSNINALDIDIVCDAGLSNIAQFVTGKQTEVFAGKEPTVNCTQYTPTRDKWMLNSRNDTLTWRAIYAIYNTFCQNTRKDCAFTFDSLRPLALEGSEKILRVTKPSNTFDLNILPKYTYLAGLNTSYGAGYSVWTMGIDDFTGNYIWLPPSIAGMGQWIFTDVNANYWDAPAGLTRGILSDALDIAFNPTIKQAGLIYGKGWNYCINWPADGITIEGQKTFQTKPSAFDRINVRRLFLRLERNTYHTLKYFLYEGNTAFTRQRITDVLDPMFSRVKVMGGLYDYKLKCDDTNNTPDVIDRNELVVDIALKPTRTAEFIQANFYALRTGASWSEAGM